MKVLSSNAIYCRIDIICIHSSKKKLRPHQWVTFSLFTCKDSPNALVKCIIQIVIIPSLDRIGIRWYKEWVQRFTFHPYFNACLEEPSIHFTWYLYIYYVCKMCILYICTILHTLAVQSEQQNVSFSFILSSSLSDRRLHNNNQKRSVHYNMHRLCRHRGKNVKTWNNRGFHYVWITLILHIKIFDFRFVCENTENIIIFYWTNLVLHYDIVWKM